MMKRITSLAITIALVLPHFAFASDWTQFRGPQRNGVSSETNWEAKWGATGPKVLWKLDLEESYSGVVVSKGRAYTTASSGTQDTVLCVNALTGESIWKKNYEHGFRRYVPDNRSNALCATPTLEGKMLYVLMREGALYCLNADNGDTIWKTELAKELNTPLPKFGMSSSPLIEKDLLLINIGKGGAAVNKKTGKIAWKSAPGIGGQSSAIIYTRNNRREAAFFGVDSVFGVDAMTGKELWRYGWAMSAFELASADPIVYGDSIFANSSNRGSKLIKLNSNAPSVIWENKNLSSDYTNSVLYNGYVYGNNRNKLTCIDVKTGETKWEEKGLGYGSLIIADGKIIALFESGELAVAEATPTGYKEISRYKVLSGSGGAFGSAGYIPPTLSNGLLYLRNSKGTLVCLDLRKKK